MTLVIVDTAGSVEVVRLPPMYKRAIECRVTVPGHPLLRQLPAAMNLWSRCAMEEVAGPAGHARLRKANDMDAWEEALLLARMAIPLEGNAYMHVAAQVR
ncbi:hypothetical protein STCU_11112 [Strigomonas culicis]|uniref:Uncharacterized protein n=1 Tax=Strigomonas culicis TaxID=28005 RepID=S9TID1_9TRYP|nr:hypothetical protein STCU_11112 [Strigomonas culicis]|eukprot:EPY16604.1 hypothetical protein STCU_11112 [Strigomonas culicis]